MYPLLLLFMFLPQARVPRKSRIEKIEITDADMKAATKAALPAEMVQMGDPFPAQMC